MQLRDIEYFLAVAKHGNVGRAADALGLGQPALSKSLRRLERALRTRLVRTTSKGVALTAAGAAFLWRARNLRLSLADAASEVAEITEGRAGHLRIGSSPALVDALVRPAYRAFRSTAAEVTFTITVGMTDTLTPALRGGELDLVVSGVPARPPEDLAQEHLLDDEFVVFAAARHALARRKRLAPVDVVGQQWVLAPPEVMSRQWIERAFAERGLPAPRSVLNTNAYSVMLSEVATSTLLGFQSRTLVLHGASRFDLVELPLKEMTWHRNVGVSYRQDGYLSRAARRFIEILKATAKEIR